MGDEFDDIRKVRNNINYYGKEISINDAERIINRIKRLRKEVLRLLNN